MKVVQIYSVTLNLFTAFSSLIMNRTERDGNKRASLPLVRVLWRKAVQPPFLHVLQWKRGA